MSRPWKVLAWFPSEIVAHAEDGDVYERLGILRSKFGFFRRSAEYRFAYDPEEKAWRCDVRELGVINESD